MRLGPEFGKKKKMVVLKLILLRRYLGLSCEGLGMEGMRDKPKERMRVRLTKFLIFYEKKKTNKYLSTLAPLDMVRAKNPGILKKAYKFSD